MLNKVNTPRVTTIINLYQRVPASLSSTTFTARSATKYVSAQKHLPSSLRDDGSACLSPRGLTITSFRFSDFADDDRWDGQQKLVTLSHGTVIGLCLRVGISLLRDCLSPMVVELRVEISTPGLLRFIQRTLQKTNEKRLIQSNDQQQHVRCSHGGAESESEPEGFDYLRKIKMTVFTFRSKSH